jgi:hypothetical protein
MVQIVEPAAAVEQEFVGVLSCRKMLRPGSAESWFDGLSRDVRRAPIIPASQDLHARCGMVSEVGLPTTLPYRQQLLFP